MLLAISLVCPSFIMSFVPAMTSVFDLMVESSSGRTFGSLTISPSILYALGSRESIGTVRECFFVNQLSKGHTVEYGKTSGDFLIDGRITAEVGGKDKSFEQIADIPDSYVFADEMEFPVGKKLPLWLAGFLY